MSLMKAASSYWIINVPLKFLIMQNTQSKLDAPELLLRESNSSNNSAAIIVNGKFE